MSVFTRTALLQLNGIEGNPSTSREVCAKHKALVATFMSEMASLGFSVSEDVFYYLVSLVDPTERCVEILDLAKASLGANVSHRVFYPNFPQQVMEALETELYVNASIHYWTLGLVVPSYLKIEREELKEENPQTEILLISREDLQAYFCKLVYAKAPLPESSTDFIDDGIEAGWTYLLKEEISFKETLARVAASVLKKGFSISHLMRVTTDVLRVMAHILDSDVQLKNKVKFKSMRQRTRRLLVKALAKVISVEDVKRHPNLWKRAFHSLHIGEYKTWYPALYEIAFKFRSENHVHTSATVVTEAIKLGDFSTAIEVLAKLPSQFARSLDKLLRDGNPEIVLNEFGRIVSSIDSKVLLQVLGHFKARPINEKERRVVFTAGKEGTALMAGPLPELEASVVEQAQQIIRPRLLSAFRDRGLLSGKNVHICPEVSEVMIPFLLASASNSKKTVGRGSRIPLDIIPSDSSKNIIRLFLHWIGKDIDLSTVVINEEFNEVKPVGFFNLREKFAWHSGDITYAPGPVGASEFIDVDMNAALASGFRYVTLDCRVFDGPAFVKHEDCFVGFMLREEPQSGEIFDASTVRAKFDLTSDEKSSIACVFDIKERTMCWVDLNLNIPRGLNTVFGNMVNDLDILKAYTGYFEKKVTMKELVELHATAVGAELVEELEADFVVGLGRGDLDVFDFATILKDWI